MFKFLTLLIFWCIVFWLAYRYLGIFRTIVNAFLWFFEVIWVGMNHVGRPPQRIKEPEA